MAHFTGSVLGESLQAPQNNNAEQFLFKQMRNQIESTGEQSMVDSTKGDLQHRMAVNSVSPILLNNFAQYLN